MDTIHLISHTHWDREWYLPYQQFRLKLVLLIDKLLELFDNDPYYKHFMLDGQVIILEDYLELRPEREDDIKNLVMNDRLLIGPWYVLPDEFLVSPEALIRNLLQGERISKRFGKKMIVGYIPDPFGHISQMPQILAGFGIQFACLQRGLDDHPCELWWQAPDGTCLLTAYLRDGYGNAASLPLSDDDRFLAEVKSLRSSLSRHSASSHLLFMHGTDHMYPKMDTSSAIKAANKLPTSEFKIIHSNLPGYLAALSDDVKPLNLSLPTISGELRSSKRHHLLPGVLSTRIWIKQRNHACETLLERWAEPFYLYAYLIGKVSNSGSGITELRSSIDYAWRLLLQNQPHDSICGCSVDQVHEEMKPRFDQVDQIGVEVTNLSLQAISTSIKTKTTISDVQSAIVCFNPIGIQLSGLTEVEIPGDAISYELIDQAGQIIEHIILNTNRRRLATMKLNRKGLLGLLGGVTNGKVTGLPVQGLVIQDVILEHQGDALFIGAKFSEFGSPPEKILNEVAPKMAEILADPSLDNFILEADVVSSHMRFVASDVPPYGYKTYFIRSVTSAENYSAIQSNTDKFSIQNEFMRVRISPQDGTLTMTDLGTGETYRELNKFLDGGDCGDEYNYCPPVRDVIIYPKVQSIEQLTDSISQSLILNLEFELPLGLNIDRQTRADKSIPVRIKSTATLVRGVPRLDFITQVENTARDHRLRAHFPAPFAVQYADYDGHFEIIARKIGVPTCDDTWIEHPRPEVPQRTFTAITGDKGGLIVANLGLREVEVFLNNEQNAEIAITLLRCVGWLSREDLSIRRGHAGPEIPTPGAQMIGTWEFKYSLIPFSPDHRSKLHAIHQAYGFNNSIKSILTSNHSGILPSHQSFLKIRPDSYIVSAIKQSEKNGGWIIRGYNIKSDTIEVELTLEFPFENAQYVNLAEELVAGKQVIKDRNKIYFQAGAHEIVTIMLT